MSCSSTLKLVALVACGRTGQGFRAVGSGLWEVCIAPISMLPLLSHASWELSGRWCAAWHSLMTMVIFTMHQTHDLAPSHGRGSVEAE